MKHSISCADAGVNCPFIAESDTVNGVVNEITAHAQDVHAEIIKKLLETMTTNELTEWLKEKVKTHSEA
jgi:predicted small metal-binding protein